MRDSLKTMTDSSTEISGRLKRVIALCKGITDSQKNQETGKISFQILLVGDEDCVAETRGVLTGNRGCLQAHKVRLCRTEDYLSDLNGVELNEGCVTWTKDCLNGIEGYSNYMMQKVSNYSRDGCVKTSAEGLRAIQSSLETVPGTLKTDALMTDGSLKSSERCPKIFQDKFQND